MKALMLNPNDQAIQVRKRDVEQLYLSDCSLCAEQAEAYYKNGEREKAMELFDRMVAQNCLDSENVSNGRSGFLTVYPYVSKKDVLLFMSMVLSKLLSVFLPGLI